MNEIAIYQASVPDRMRYAEALSGSSLLPRDYVGKPANVLLAIEYGAALGIPPMTAIQGVHVINGKPTASAGLIGALVRKAGHRLRVSGDDKRAVCEIVRGDDPDFTFRSEWTMERAAQAKLTGKDTWKSFPAAMLKARAITECARDACPEALAGVQYTAEELGADNVHADSYPQTDTGSASLAASPNETGAVAGSNPAVSSDPVSDDIVDAEVVDEDGAGGAEGEAAEPAPGPDPYAGNRDHGDAVTEPQLRKLGVLLKGQSRDQALAIVSTVIGRDVESRNDLTKREAMRLIDALEKQEAAS